MYRLALILTCLLMVASSSMAAMAATTTAPKKLQDLYFGEVLYYAFQEEWFEAIARLDTELDQHHGLDQPELDSLFAHIGLAHFAVGDFELAYRMHRRAGRAISALINGNVSQELRNEAIFRLAKIYFQKDQPVNALHAIERVDGAVPKKIRDDLAFLRSQILMVNGRFEDAAEILKRLENVKSLKGFASYNLGISLLMLGNTKEGLAHLDMSGRIKSDDPLTLAIKDKSNLVLGDKLLGAEQFGTAKEVLDRVRLEGPFSNQALLGSGWADASAERFEQALVPWSILVEREVTDRAVQEAMLALPYAYGKLGIYGKAALLYNSALAAFTTEIDKLSDSIKSIREGAFLRALVREELKQNSNWVVKLRNLPETPETYYLLDLMASHDFQESLKNYLDLEQLRKKLESWTTDLDAFEEIIVKRRAYYEPLLPEIDREFRLLDSRMRLRVEQRDRIQKRLEAMLVAPRPDYLATAKERILNEQLDQLSKALPTSSAAPSDEGKRRIQRLRGILRWNIYTDYDRRLTEAYHNLHALNQDVEMLQKQYDSFVRKRQAATQSYEGYGESIRIQRIRIAASLEKVETLMARQGHMLENMAIHELSENRKRLEQFQVKVLFAMADSYDRAARAEEPNREEPIGVEK
ncbi:tetratricopeptide repeat protein [Desulfosediminicola sp.]|uniref:tetratricopeptide repeat protein n=1 Tax=Desulfosediminicola sp. TaxID=2886825 RepID=UPI003AF282D7